MGTPLPFMRRGCIVFLAIRCSSPLPLPAGLASIVMQLAEEPSQLARPGITLPLPTNFGAAPFANPDILIGLFYSSTHKHFRLHLSSVAGSSDHQRGGRGMV